MEFQIDNITDVVTAVDTSEGVRHQNIATMAPTEGIIINRTKKGVSPFVDIRKERLVDQATHQPTNTFGVWVEDPEEGWKNMGVVSENYLLLPNQKVRELALQIAENSGLAYRESRIFWDGAKFAQIIDFVGIREAVEEGDEVGLSLITRNSYDRSWKYEAALMGKHWICDNGAISGEFFARVSFKHLGANDNAWEQVVREGLSVVGSAGENLHRYVEGLRILSGMKLTDERLREVWKMLAPIPDSIKGRIMGRYVEKEKPTLYGLLQAGTYTFWHGEKSTASDYSHNDTYTTALLDYGFAHRN